MRISSCSARRRAGAGSHASSPDCRLRPPQRTLRGSRRRVPRRHLRRVGSHCERRRHRVRPGRLRRREGSRRRRLGRHRRSTRTRTLSPARPGWRGRFVVGPRHGRHSCSNGPARRRGRRRSPSTAATTRRSRSARCCSVATASSPSSCASSTRPAPRSMPISAFGPCAPPRRRSCPSPRPFAPASPESGRLMYVVIAGGGKVGSNVTRSLIALGHEVTLVEQRRDRFAHLDSEFGPSAILGDATEIARARTRRDRASAGHRPGRHRR